MSNVKVKWGDRWAIIGGTGSGKTTLAKALLNTYYRASQGRLPIYILDSKISGDFKEYYRPGVGVLHMGNTLPPLHDASKYGAFQVWQPEEDDLDLYDEWLKNIYKARKPALIFFDELSSISNANGSKFPRYYDIVLKQGRGLSLGTISISQSPAYAPNNLLRQTTHLIRMRLNDEYDVKKLSKLMGRVVEEEPGDLYGFYYKDCTKPRKTSPTQYYGDMEEFF